MNIRKLNKDDYNNFYKLINQFRKTEFDNNQFIDLLDKLDKQKNNEIWIIEKDNIFIASATIIYEYKYIFNICCLAHIEDVIVDINYRRLGYGKKLIEFLINLAKNNNCYKITLDCSYDNIFFYESCGFEKRGHQMTYLLN